MVRFVSEFGVRLAARSAPFIDEELLVNEWPDLDWDRLAAEHGYERRPSSGCFHPSDFDTFEEWRDTTQHYQSHVLKVQIEALRRLKYRPTGGFCFSSLNDSAPSISTSILDADRVPKFACDAVQAACAPRARGDRSAPRPGGAGRPARPRRAPGQRPARRRSTSRWSMPWRRGSRAGSRRASNGGDSADRWPPTTWSRSAGSASTSPTPRAC